MVQLQLAAQAQAKPHPRDWGLATMIGAAGSQAAAAVRP